MSAKGGVGGSKPLSAKKMQVFVEGGNNAWNCMNFINKKKLAILLIMSVKVYGGGGAKGLLEDMSSMNIISFGSRFGQMLIFLLFVKTIVL